MAKMRICVLQSSMEGSSGAISEVDPYKKPEVYDTSGEFEWSGALLRKATSAAQLVELAAGGRHDLYLNLCDGAWDEDRAGRDVVDALERLNLPYTGANPAFYDPTKVEMKMAAQYYGVQVPAWVHVEQGSPEAVEAGLAAILAPPSRGGLRFPLIVKHPSGYGSVGMSRDSKVASEKQLREQVALLLRQFGGALVEEFIPGREFTVLVVEEPTHAAARQQQQQQQQQESSTNGDGSGRSAVDSAQALDPDLCSFRAVSYTPVECAFGPGEDFKHFGLKWTDYESLTWRPCADPKLAERLKEAARNTFIATRGVSYGRCDFRVDPAGRIYLLEINPNCGVLYPPGLHGSADYILSLGEQQHDHMHFIRTIAAAALERHRLKQRKAVPAYFRCPAAGPTSLPAAAAAAAAAAAEPAPSNGTVHGTTAATAAAAAEPSGSGSEPPVEVDAEHGSGGGAGGWGLRAVVPIRCGEVVQRNEQRKHVLASKGFVRRCWPEGSRQREWFDAYAYPVSDEVWVTWSDDPADWTPLNHSCDPNTWLVGMDAVARRDIAPGEQITIDYATYCTEHMAPFDCECGAAACRGRVAGTDHLQPWVGDVYGHHVSAYVAARRRQAGLAPQADSGSGSSGTEAAPSNGAGAVPS